ncbi:hypothetical protein BH11BAC1_BH11BAC1_09190 [soil metagenome]
MRNLLVLFVFFLQFGLLVEGQATFQRTYGTSSNDLCSFVHQTSDSGFILAGLMLGDLSLIKINSIGDTIWTRSYGTVDNDAAYSVQQTFDGGYILLGEEGYHDRIYLIRTNAIGDTLWAKVFSWGVFSDYGLCVKQTTDSGFIISGTTFLVGGNQMCAIKTNSFGDTLWTRVFKTNGSPWASNIEQTFDGGFIMVGTTLTTSFSDDVYCIRLNSLGDTLWTKSYGGIGNDIGSCIRQTQDSGFIIVGASSSFGSSINDYDLYLLKTNASGDTLWTRTLGDTASTQGGNFVSMTKDSSFIVCGSSRQNILLCKVNLNGDTLWTRTYGSSLSDGAFCVYQTIDSGYIIGGATWNYGAGASDAYIIKTDSNGISSCNLINQHINFEHPPTDIRSENVQQLSATCYLDNVFITIKSGVITSDACMTSVIENNKVQNFEIITFPNPAATTFTISSPQSFIKSISIFNILGEEVLLSQTASNNLKPLQVTIDVSSFPSSIYFVLVETGNGIAVQKLVKQ